MATGRRPNTDDLGLDKTGVKQDKRDYIEVDDELRTSVPGIWALGDCNGRGAFTHTAWNDYEIVADNLLEGAHRRVSDRVPAYADPVPVVSDVEGQPVAANAERLAKALDMLGAPLPADTAAALKAAVTQQDAKAVQAALDPQVLFVVNINPEARVKVARGPAEPTLQQAGFVPVLVKVVNDSTVKKPLHVTSPQAGPRWQRPGRNEKDPKADPDRAERFLDVEMFTTPPMTEELSGLKVEYAIAPDLQQRGRQARGDHRLRRRPGDPGPRLPRRDGRALRREARPSR